MLKLNNLSNLDDDEIQQNITDFIQEINTLNLNSPDDTQDIEDVKHDILDLIQLYIHVKNSKMVDFLLKILLDSNVIKLTNTDLTNMIDEVKNDQQFLQFISLYQNSKWSGKIRKKTLGTKDIRKNSIRRKLSGRRGRG